MTKSLSIVIVTWNTRDMLRDCLSSLQRTLIKKDIDIYVVDNSSVDGSDKMVTQDYPHVTLICSPGNIGFGRGNNLTKSHINTPFVLFLNPDTIVPEDSLSKMLHFMMKNHKVALLGCKMRNPDGNYQELGIQWFPSPIKEFFHMLFITKKNLKLLKNIIPYQNPSVSNYVKKLYGGCLLARREALDKVGLFDERYFMYGEDVDLSQQIILQGWDLYYYAGTEIYHVGGGASDKAGSDFAILMKAESIEKLMDKYYGTPGKWLYRLCIFTAASMRFYFLIFLRLVRLFDSGSKMQIYKRSFNKYRALILWSLNLKHAIIK